MARRTYFPIVLDRTLEFCEALRKRGPGAVDAQNALQRLSLDVIMVGAFHVDPRAVDFGECEILDSLHYCFEEIFRFALLPHRPAWPSALMVKGSEQASPSCVILNFLLAGTTAAWAHVHWHALCGRGARDVPSRTQGSGARWG